MSSTTTSEPKPTRPALRFFLRGLAISLPSILTIVILLWLATGINTYIIRPTSSAVKYVLAEILDESVATGSLVVLGDPPELRHCGQNYVLTDEAASTYRSLPPAEQTAGWLRGRTDEIYVPLVERAVPYEHYAALAKVTPSGQLPQTATSFYMDYAAETYFKSAFLLSAFAVILVIVALYFLGRIVSARIGAWAIGQVERNILGRLPVIRNVYGSVKQVTDFLFTESKVEYRRVVAVEYPRRGIWSIALVTGEGMLDVATAVGEPCLSVVVPSSPMPVTGYTMCVPRSEVLDLNVSVDQAMQFVVSCGVLVPPQQKVTAELLKESLTRRLAGELRGSATERSRPSEDRDDRTVGEHPSDQSPPANSSSESP